MSSSDKKGYGALLAIMLCLITVGCAVYFAKPIYTKVEGLFSKDAPVEVIVEDTMAVLTVQEVLAARELERDMRYLDSVYMEMPDESVIAICMEYGTDMSPQDIAAMYLMHIDSYKDVELGARIERGKTNVEPDPIPIESEPDTETVNH